LLKHQEQRKFAKRYKEAAKNSARMVEDLLSGCVTAKKLKEGIYHHFVVTTSCSKGGFIILTEG